MAENRVKVVIEADAAGAITSFGDFLKVLDRTGATAKLSDAALAKLADRFRDKLSADQAQAALERTRQQIERLGTSAGLSQQELSKLMRQLGIAPSQIAATSQSLSTLTSGATASTGAFDALIAQLTAAVAAYVSLRSIIGLVSDSLTAAARNQTMGVVLEKVGENAGYSREQMQAFAASVQQAGISIVESKESVAKMAAAQLDLTKSAELARVAQDAAVIANTNSSDAFGKLVQGITTGQTVLLHHMGIMVDLDDAYKKYASQLGITKGELTESQKRTAALNAVLDEGAKRAGTYEAAMGTVGKQLQSFKRYVQDFETSLGTAFLDAASSNVSAATESMRELQDVIKDQATQDMLASLAGGLANVLNIIITETPSAVGAIVAGIQDIKNTWASVPDEVKTLLKYGTAAALGARVGGLGGAVVATGLTVLDGSDTFRNWRIGAMEENASKMNDALYSETDPGKRSQLEDDLNAQLNLLQNYRDKRLSILQQFSDDSKKYNTPKNGESTIPGIPAKSEQDAANKWWAEYNAGMRGYKETVDSALAIGEKNKKHAPIDQQQGELAKTLKSQQEAIAKGWTAAYQAGDWDTVRKLNDSATSALGAYNDGLDALDRKANRGSKAAQNAAIAAERYSEQASAYLLQAQDQYVQLVAQFEGDALGAKLAAIDKRYDAAASSISKSMIGAKGSTEAAQAALDQLAKNRALEKKIAEADAWKKSMQEAANMLGELGRLSGDPNALYASSMTTAQTWEADQKKRINALQDEAEKTKQLGELQQVMALKELEARKQAYEGLAGVSDKYWEAERQRLEQHLAVVKQNATNETAYKMYEAQQWDAYNKALLEKQEQYAGTFAETFAAKWALAFGTYKSEATKAKEAWEQTAQSAIDAANSVVDGIAGGVGDMVRSFGDGTASIESLFQNLRSRILDIFASMIEEMLRKWLKDFVGRLGSGDFSLGSLFGGDSASSGGSGINLSSLTGSGGGSGGITGSVSSGIDSVKSLGGYLGKAAGSSLGDYFATEASSGASLFVGDGNALSKIFSDGVDMSALATQATTYGTIPVEAMASTYNMAETAAMSASSLSSVLSSTLGVVGAIGGVVGLVSSLFGSSEKTEKTGSGYKIAINAGTLNMSGVDFYKTTTQSALGGTSTSNFTVDTGMVNPDVAKAVNDALKDVAENLHDFGKTLGITTGDLLSMLSMPEMTITEGQLDSYIRNSSNVMAFQALDTAGLRGAFDFVAEKYEVYVDEFERLADAYKLVGGYTEAYGYDLTALAGITADQIAEIRQVNTETAQGTSQAIMSMATAMGATSDQLAELAANATDGSQALAVTDEQLSKILEADYASKLVDAVGGEDAFETLMTNLVKNTLNSVEAYEENATYYAGKANDAIAELGKSGVTIDNFWQQFDQAMHGALSVDEFEKWADSAGWVNALNVVTDALDDWADTVAQSYQNLEVRALRAQGLDYQADLAEQLAAAEWELAQAREAGYDAAYLQRLAEVQALEYAAAIAEHAQDYADELLSAQKRYATAVDDSSALIQIAIAENAAELQEMAKKFNWSVGSAEEGLFRGLEQAQWAEVIAQIEEMGQALTEATEAMQRDLEARRATIAGYDEEAQALQMVAGFADEMAQAYEDGIDPGLLADLMEVQIEELAKYWSDTLDGMQSDLADLYRKQADLLDSLSGNTQSAIEDLYDLFTRYQAGEDDLADSILDSISSIADAIDNMVSDIYDTIYEIRTGEDYTTDTADTVASNALAYYNEQLALAASGDTDAMASIGQYATSYLSAVKSSTGNEATYNAARDYVTSTLQGLASGSSGTSSQLGDIAKTVTGDQIAEAQEALRRAEVAQLKSTYETLLAQAAAAFSGSSYGALVQRMAGTGFGWSGGVDALLASDYWEGGTRSMRAADAILSGVGGMSAEKFVAWYIQTYGTGTGYVDWSGALSQWVSTSQSVWPGVSALPSGIMSTYNQAMAAYDSWQALKSQYGYTLGGVISSESGSGDNTLVFANSGERVLTPGQNDAFEELVFGGRSDGLASALLARVDRLTEEVVKLRAESGQWDRLKHRQLSDLNERQEGWELNGSLTVGVKGGPVEVTGKVEVAS